MANSIPQSAIPAPTLKTLFLATGIALVLAFIVLILAVLPAEYNIDVTGLGRKLGFTDLATSTSASQLPQAFACKQQLNEWNDAVVITIPAHKGLEYKFQLPKDGVLEYAWTSNGMPLYFDFHGEPQGDTTGYFKSYQETTADHVAGKQSMPFAGSHGWYWENKTAHPVTVMLSTKGDYQVLGLR